MILGRGDQDSDHTNGDTLNFCMRILNGDVVQEEHAVEWLNEELDLCHVRQMMVVYSVSSELTSMYTVTSSAIAT